MWEWSDNLKQQTLLQAKLNAYLRFVESGDILERYPNAKERRVVFCVVFKFAPDQEGQQFLARVRQVAESAGIGIPLRSLGCFLQGGVRDQNEIA